MEPGSIHNDHDPKPSQVPFSGRHPPLFVLIGPTAVGKTALGLEVALRINAEIVSGRLAADLPRHGHWHRQALARGARSGTTPLDRHRRPRLDSYPGRVSTTRLRRRVGYHPPGPSANVGGRAPVSTSTQWFKDGTSPEWLQIRVCVRSWRDSQKLTAPWRCTLA